MKGFKSRALLASGAAVLMLAAACTNGGTPAPTGPGPLPTDNVNLTFWWWGSAARAATTQQVITLFEQKYPFIHVQGEPQDFTNYFTNLSTQFAGGSAPDIITMGGAYPQSYGRDSNLLDLGTVSSDLDSSVFPANLLQSGAFGGKQYGVPTGGNAIAVLINPAIFQAAGVAIPNDDTWSWDDFANIAKQIQSKLPGTYGAETRIYDMIGAYAGQNEGLYNTDGSLAVSEGTLTKLFQMEKDLIGTGEAPADLANQVLAATNAQTLFGQGKSAMLIGYSNQVNTYAPLIGKPVQLLRLPGESQAKHPGTALLPSQYYTINATTKYPRQAATFVNFLVNSPDAGKLILADRGLPASPAVLQAITPLLNANDQVFAAFQAKNSSKFGPSFNPPAWATDINKITQTVDSEVISGQLTPAAAATEWIKEMNDSKAKNS
jgi:multiple sugar transport system substrate-binding protein